MTTDEVAHASATAATPRSSFGTSAMLFSQLMMREKMGDFLQSARTCLVRKKGRRGPGKDPSHELQAATCMSDLERI